MSDEAHFIKLGRPIEGAFRSMLEAGFRHCQFSREERQFMRKLFFAGARAAMASAGEVDSDTWKAINAELEAFGRRLVTELPVKGRG